ncbi:MAG: response regulator [Phycisphaerae bacterium]|nr:response regulator [Phycisphaerae bacterium]
MPPEPTQPDTLHVLLVEDNDDHAELIRRSLGDHNVPNTLDVVRDGAAAMDYLFGSDAGGAAPKRPHLVLLDLRLPKIDGLEVLRRIKESEALKELPVVVVTTSEAESDVARAYQHHANSYLVKPLDFREFTKLMEDLGLYWLGWNRNPWA